MAKQSNRIMSEFFLELFSEEIPANLQNNSRVFLFESFQKLFKEKNISFKESNCYSTPNRLVIVFKGLPKEITQEAKEIKGPNINAPEKAIEGFLRSNKLNSTDLYKKKTEKGEFYFFKKPSQNFLQFTYLKKIFQQF